MRVVPSQVVNFINTHLPMVDPGHEIQLSPEVRGPLLALLDLIERIPDHLMPAEPDFGLLIKSIHTVRTQMNRTEFWNPVHGFERLRIEPILQIREVLLRCPDNRPSPETQELLFIEDSELREEIRKDASAAHSALRNAEWKATAVLAGSVAEALLLWAIEGHRKTHPEELEVAVQKAKSRPKSDPQEWVLANYVEVATELKLISTQACTQARLIQDFRNLIHPGRAKRLAQESNRATALSALAGMERLINELSK